MRRALATVLLLAACGREQPLTFEGPYATPTPSPPPTVEPEPPKSKKPKKPKQKESK